MQRNLADDAGSMSLVISALLCCVLAFGCVGLLLGSLVVGQARLGQLADEAARAGAIAALHGTSGCDAVRSFLGTSTAHLESCSEADTVRVTLSQRQVAEVFGLPALQLHATARAGP